MKELIGELKKNVSKGNIQVIGHTQGKDFTCITIKAYKENVEAFTEINKYTDETKREIDEYLAKRDKSRTDTSTHEPE